MHTIADALAAAIACQQSFRLEEAEALYQDVLAADPCQPSALYLYGLLNLGTGRTEAARDLLEQAVAIRPTHAESRFALANALLRHGDYPGAIARYRALLVQRPDHLGAILNLAAALRESGDPAAAASLVRAALARTPGVAALQTSLGSALLACNEPAPALAAAEGALAIDPGIAEALFVRGTALSALGRPADAAMTLELAVIADPLRARAHLNLGNALADLDRMEEAVCACRRAIALEPGLAEAHASLGFMLTAQHQLDAAIAACETAIQLRPDFAQAHWNQGIAHLLAGDYARGWAKYEWRKLHDLYAQYHRLAGPTWEGEALDGRTLLVHAEQGLGDAIQFCRFMPALAARGARVVLACDPRLFGIFQGLPGVAALAAKDGALPPYDLWVDQMSLPRLLGTTLDSIPSPHAYLRADPGRVAAWRARLPAGRRVGLVWAGNPAHSNDARRSLPPAALAPVLAVPGVRFISLQVGRDHTLPDAATPVFDAGPGLTDFQETAAVIATLDRVIAVDTSVAHLAGALGCATWVMLPHAPDWRWVLWRNDTPWYASMRLFRQPRPGDWASVTQAVAAALHE